jgi:hypothetical protein
MSAPIPTPAEAEAALRDAKLKAACGLEYAVNLMNDTLTNPTTPLRVVGEIYDRFSKLVGVEKQQEQRGAGFKLVINLNSETKTLQNMEVEALEAEFTAENIGEMPEYMANPEKSGNCTTNLLASL